MWFLEVHFYLHPHGTWQWLSISGVRWWAYCNRHLLLSVLSDVDHRSRHDTTGIELLAIDTFPGTVNDRCVSSPEINMLRRQRLMRYSVWYTCFVTVCFWEKQEVDDDSIFFCLSLEIPRYLELYNFIFISFPPKPFDHHLSRGHSSRKPNSKRLIYSFIWEAMVQIEEKMEEADDGGWI